MTCYDLAISTWGSTNISNGRRCSGGVLPNLIGAVPTATATRIITSFIKDSLQRKISADDITLFTMQHSQKAFAEIWNEPEEDIWDQL